MKFVLMFFVVLSLFGCGKTESKQKLSNDLIMSECMALAGIPPNEPDYKVSPEQLQTVSACAERKIKQ